jgi:hypothetical protein
VGSSEWPVKGPPKASKELTPQFYFHQNDQKPRGTAL